MLTDTIFPSRSQVALGNENDSKFNLAGKSGVPKIRKAGYASLSRPTRHGRCELPFRSRPPTENSEGDEPIFLLGMIRIVDSYGQRIPENTGSLSERNAVFSQIHSCFGMGPIAKWYPALSHICLKVKTGTDTNGYFCRVCHKNHCQFNLAENKRPQDCEGGKAKCILPSNEP